MCRETKRFVYLAILSAMAITLNVIEYMYIGAFSFGIRIGLANIISLITICILSTKDMIYVNVLRVLVSGLLRGVIFGSTFWIGLSGVVLSTFVIWFFHRQNSSLMFTSIMSSVAHSIGQILMVMFFYQQALIVSILPYLLVGSIPMGVLTGIIAKMILDRIKPLSITK